MRRRLDLLGITVYATILIVVGGLWFWYTLFLPHARESYRAHVVSMGLDVHRAAKGERIALPAGGPLFYEGKATFGDTVFLLHQSDAVREEKLPFPFFRDYGDFNLQDLGLPLTLHVLEVGRDLSLRYALTAPK